MDSREIVTRAIEFRNPLLGAARSKGSVTNVSVAGFAFEAELVDFFKSAVDKVGMARGNGDVREVAGRERGMAGIRISARMER